ncbi:hypothetical protein [Microvirga massiliensis]|nr:hypothetical protein [Microvirga massiliensis]
MPKGERRGNREAKKPKQDKPKAAPVTSPFIVTQGKPGTTQGKHGGKK